MNELEQMLKEQKLELDKLEVPEELESRLRGALDHQPSVPRVRPKWKISIVAIFAMALFLTFNIDTLAFYGKKLIGYDSIMSGPLIQLNESGMGQIIGKSYTFENGITVTLDGVMVDDNQLIAYYSMRDPSGEKRFDDIGTYLGIKGKTREYMPNHGQGEISSDEKEIKMVVVYEPPSPGEKQLKWRTTSQLPDGTTEVGEIPFELDKTKAMGHTFSKRINGSIKIDGGKMRLETIKASPTTTIVKGKLQNIVELALDQITNQRIRPMGLDIRLIANGEELPWRSSGIRTDFKGINFETTYDPLPMELESLQICLAGITADYDVNQQFPLIKEGEKTSLTVLGQKVDIDEVYEADGETYITITTEESVLLSKVYLLIDGKKIPLEETISDEGSTDGNHTRTLRFSGVGGELQLKIQSIEYEKAYDAMVDILVK